LLENGEDGFIYVGNSVNPVTLEQIFGVSSLAGVPNQVIPSPHLSPFTSWILNLLQMWITARIIHYTCFKPKMWHPLVDQFPQETEQFLYSTLGKPVFRTLKNNSCLYKECPMDNCLCPTEKIMEMLYVPDKFLNCCKLINDLLVSVGTGAI